MSSHLDRKNLVNKELIIWLSGNFSRGIKWIVLSGQDGSVLPAGSQSHRAISFILPTRGASHIIQICIMGCG